MINIQILNDNDIILLTDFIRPLYKLSSDNSFKFRVLDYKNDLYWVPISKILGECWTKKKISYKELSKIITRKFQIMRCNKESYEKLLKLNQIII